MLRGILRGHVAKDALYRGPARIAPVLEVFHKASIVYRLTTKRGLRYAVFHAVRFDLT